MKRMIYKRWDIPYDREWRYLREYIPDTLFFTKEPRRRLRPETRPYYHKLSDKYSEIRSNSLPVLTIRANTESCGKWRKEIDQVGEVPFNSNLAQWKSIIRYQSYSIALRRRERRETPKTTTRRLPWNECKKREIINSLDINHEQIIKIA